MKEKLEIEEDILVERTHHTRRYREMMVQETERELWGFSILKTDILLIEGKNHCRQGFFVWDSQRS